MADISFECSLRRERNARPPRSISSLIRHIRSRYIGKSGLFLFERKFRSRRVRINGTYTRLSRESQKSLYFIDPLSCEKSSALYKIKAHIYIGLFRFRVLLKKIRARSPISLRFQTDSPRLIHDTLLPLTSASNCFADHYYLHFILTPRRRDISAKRDWIVVLGYCCKIYIASVNLLQPTSHNAFIYTSDILAVFLETVAF